MKKINRDWIIIISLVLGVFLVGVIVFNVLIYAAKDDVVKSLPKASDSKSYVDGFVDYTIYEKYYYEDTEKLQKKLDKNSYLSPVTEADIAEFNSYVDNFEKWLEHTYFLNDYDFDRSIIDTSDYFYITGHYYDEPDFTEDEKFWNYDVYFFDTQTNTLYYFHNDT